jgi:hypothetical protein
MIYRHLVDGNISSEGSFSRQYDKIPAYSGNLEFTAIYRIPANTHIFKERLG